MKKITLILISIILIATLASCDGSVNSVLAASEEVSSSKTITLQLVDNGILSFKFKENSTTIGSSISFTTDAETWADLNGTSLEYIINSINTNSNAVTDTFTALQFSTNSGNAVLNCTSTFYSRIEIKTSESGGSNIAATSTIVDGTTYYLFPIISGAS
ncbi:MAG: hypothetical protein K6F82_05010 [Sphaerochaetaceae bacterium]|nr:hypothetical protein [Sphaerochaetaceae bacterium]